MSKHNQKRRQIAIYPQIRTGTAETKDMKCRNCRHSNQETMDFEEGLVACKFDGGMRLDASCNVTLKCKDGTYYLYEPYTDMNCTWYEDADFVITFVNNNTGSGDTNA